MTRSLAWLLFAALGAVSTLSAQQKSTLLPATVAEAQKAIDLSKFPMIDLIEEPNTSTVAAQSYRSKGDVEATTKKLQSKLSETGFKALEGAMVTAAYASVNFQKDRFVLSLTVTPAAEPGSCQVNLQNLGNIAISEIPLPEGLVQTYSGPGMSLLTTDMKAEDVKKSCREKLEQNGWQWFGDTEVSFFARRNAVRIQVMVTTPAVEGQKTFVQLSATQLSTDYPVPKNLVMLQYSDNTGGVIMDSNMSVAEMFQELRASLEGAGWKCTTDRPIKVGFHEHLLFRGPAKELLDFEVFEFEKLTRCRGKFYTAAQLEQAGTEANK